MTIRVKRVYDAPSEEDGYRVLVDRLWPRGLTKAAAGVDLWMREVAPSDDLRKWFHHEAGLWPGFRERYEAELADRGDDLARLAEIEREHGTVTLVYGAKDEEHNQAVVLAEVLGRRMRPPKRRAG